MKHITAPLVAALSQLLSQPDFARVAPSGPVDAARDLLAHEARTDDPTLALAFELAGTLRAMTVTAEGANGSAGDQNALAAAKQVLLDFDRTNLPLHAHYVTQIIHDDEPFDAIALTSSDADTYVQSGQPGELLAFVPLEGGPAGEELARRLALAGAQPFHGGSLDQIGNALRASKALIEALLAGEHRSQGDLRDVLANFDGLTATAAPPASPAT